MKKAASLILVLLLGSIAPITHNQASAQAKVLGPGYAVQEFSMSGSPQSYEKKCHYFLFSTVFGKDQPRVSFQYALPDGKTESEMPRVEYLTIVIDESQSAPKVQEAGKNDDGKMQFTLYMNSATADQEGPCLVGAKRK
jgi:hypothetical protein